MKLVSTAILAAGLVALSACGGGAETNVAANNTSDALYNVAPDDLGTELDNELLGNEAATNVGADNAATDNTTGNVQ